MEGLGAVYRQGQWKPGDIPEQVFILEIFSDGFVAFIHADGKLDIAPMKNQYYTSCFTVEHKTT